MQENPLDLAVGIMPGQNHERWYPSDGTPRSGVARRMFDLYDDDYQPLRTEFTWRPNEEVDLDQWVKKGTIRFKDEDQD